MQQVTKEVAGRRLSANLAMLRKMLKYGVLTQGQRDLTVRRVTATYTDKANLLDGGA